MQSISISGKITAMTNRINIQIWLLPAVFWLLASCVGSTATATITPTEPRVTPPPTASVVDPIPEAVLLKPASQLGKGIVFDSALSPDGKYVAVSSSVGVYLYGSQTFETIWFQATDKEFAHLEFSPDSHWLALANGQDHFKHHQPEIWEVENGHQIHTLPSIRDCKSINWSPDGSELLTLSANGEIKRWQASTGNLLAQIQAGEEPCHGGEACFNFNAIWSPDGKRIISTSSLALKIWDAFTGKELFVLNNETLGGSPGRTAASPVPDDPRIIMGRWNFEKGALVIDSQNGQVLHFIDS